jgi:hypothetical protein
MKVRWSIFSQRKLGSGIIRFLQHLKVKALAVLFAVILILLLLLARPVNYYYYFDEWKEIQLLTMQM